MKISCELITEENCWITSNGPFQLEFFYEFWYRITFVKCSGSLNLQKEQMCGWKYDPNLTPQEVLVEITGKFKILIVLGKFFQIFSHVL